ncbi:gamma-glutamyl-gamma-aminobutyrate hydrolase family protein [Collinsella aerofaciens]|uniref:gamma-glutamyl-gamma-aminobutyrate hydrolase family protein n=1 Tax=Collinsella aerofaciens TaxID=74426 RepID=UPI00232BEBA1|nr:gamma-glutamyl-gamma-aminobutyrate hydrolase family protein [Collinsella aerofaciens]MDB1879499.1 gamma-glutamyl-gamma-aminobutyrate hydrolase family protein [Collinsella aerofaciens]MDB1880814.1 gamma-glutamyl-gamma-aminobutyrate hydrolase family protein [Collinsella aerofaciens]MDB1883202.1 gamma-glutamyl-gamma-aminobutyrate hydrolase family protein [Collinsella aerofaciens]MDB1887280.1 gamma-glutamyl-gamma-aminobutyrate hydrolase family protein [Collinsella aerofaciens]
MIGTRTSSSYTPHVDVDPADRPLILVAPRWEEAKPYLSETLSPNEEIASVFVDAILAAGGLPLQMSITEDIEVIRHYVDIADGIAIPGGPDVNPKRWGDDRPYDPTLCCEIRDSFEFKLVGEVLRAKKPLFTTCRGTQLLNVATGGTLCMDVPSLGARGPHAVAPYPRAQRPRASRRGRAGLVAGARAWRAQAYPDQLRTPLLHRSSG